MQHRPAEEEPRKLWQLTLYRVIFEAESTGGKLFDVVLLIGIVFSVLAVLLESVEGIRVQHGTLLRQVEWFFTTLFTIEYGLRLISVRRAWRYALSFFGLVDLAAILPTLLSLVFAGTQTLIVVRAFRLLRIFRVFKAARWLGEANVLSLALKASLRKILVFLGTVLVLVLIMGALMYLIEGEQYGFTSIPKSMYWAIQTMTTVGYGDIAPGTTWGQFLAACLMIMGYGIIAVPTGIVSVELAQASIRGNTLTCSSCLLEGHLPSANYCRECGAKLRDE